MRESVEPSSDKGGRRDSAQMMGDWSTAGGFFSSILAGLLIGLAGDYFLNTQPWLVVIGIVTGFAVGFWRMVVYSNRILDQASNPRLQRLAKLQAETKAPTQDDEDES